MPPSKCKCGEHPLPGLESRYEYMVEGHWQKLPRCGWCGRLQYRGEWYHAAEINEGNVPTLDSKGVVYLKDGSMSLEAYEAQRLERLEAKWLDYNCKFSVKQGDQSVRESMTFKVSVKTLREAASAKAETVREQEKEAAAELDAFRKKQDEETQAQCGQYRVHQQLHQDCMNSDEEKLIKKAEELCAKAAGLEHWVDLFGVEDDGAQKEVERRDLEYFGVVEEFKPLATI